MQAFETVYIKYTLVTTLMLEEVSNKMTLCLWENLIEQNQDQIYDMEVQQATLAESVTLKTP